MDKRQLGSSTLAITPVIMGTWALGGWLWGGTAKNNPSEAIQASLAEGINCIDTAPVYGFGLSEELVGQAIKDKRNQVIIATKCGLVWDERKGSTRFFDTADASGRPLTVFRNLRKESILKECDSSLQRLGVDEIDLYQCHWPDPGTPLDDTIDALETLKDRGKIREWGVSNFSLEQLQVTSSYNKPVSDQPKYNLLTRDIESEIKPYCRENNIGLICYSPMEMGLLTGQIGMDHEFPEDDTRRNRPWFEKSKRQQVLDALQAIQPIAENYNVSLAQLAISWVTSQAGVTAAIVGARTAEQAVSNAAAATLSLTAEDLQQITTAFEPLKLDQAYDPANAKR